MVPCSRAGCRRTAAPSAATTTITTTTTTTTRNTTTTTTTRNTTTTTKHVNRAPTTRRRNVDWEGFNGGKTKGTAVATDDVYRAAYGNGRTGKSSSSAKRRQCRPRARGASTVHLHSSDGMAARNKTTRDYEGVVTNGRAAGVAHTNTRRLRFPPLRRRTVQHAVEGTAALCPADHMEALAEHSN